MKVDVIPSQWTTDHGNFLVELSLFLLGRKNALVFEPWTFLLRWILLWVEPILPKTLAAAPAITLKSLCSMRRQWRSQLKNLVGAKMLDFRRIALFCLKNASQSTKWLYFLKMWGGHGPFDLPWLRLCAWSVCTRYTPVAATEYAYPKA